MSAIVDGSLAVAGIITAMMVSVLAIRETEPGNVSSQISSAEARVRGKRAA